MAIDYAQCEFYGFDIAEPAKLSEIEKLHQPKNCHIKQADVFDGFDYDANTFDFVHQRIMYSVYPTDRVSWMFQEILRITKPNGWVEFVEPDLTPKRAGPLFSKDMVIAFKHFGPLIYEYIEAGAEFDKEKYDIMIDAAFDECAEYQTFFNIRWAYGKKVVSSAI
ncbi:hypothetical protein G6F56_009218 [Rhizopus delemar]|nr:hypothetical protein G6F56_009218 [Rhizopus delemar]